jgi:flagellin
MTINQVSMNVQQLNDIQARNPERINTLSNINGSNDSSDLASFDSSGKQSSLLQSIDNMQSGIALSNIADSALEAQEGILEKIHTETLKAMNGTLNENDRESIANQISKYVGAYDSISQSTSFNSTTLLKTNNDGTDDLSVFGDEGVINMGKVDTVTLSDSLKSLMEDFSTNPDSMKKVLELVKDGIDQLSNYRSDFGSAANAMYSSAKHSIDSERVFAESQTTTLTMDIAKDVTDFSKNNISMQLGIFVQSQANASQGRAISLLSL